MGSSDGWGPASLSCHAFVLVDGWLSRYLKLLCFHFFPWCVKVKLTTHVVSLFLLWVNQLEAKRDPSILHLPTCTETACSPSAPFTAVPLAPWQSCWLLGRVIRRLPGIHLAASGCQPTTLCSAQSIKTHHTHTLCCPSKTARPAGTGTSEARPCRASQPAGVCLRPAAELWIFTTAAARGLIHIPASRWLSFPGQLSRDSGGCSTRSPTSRSLLGLCSAAQPPGWQRVGFVGPCYVTATRSLLNWQLHPNLIKTSIFLWWKKNKVAFIVNEKFVRFWHLNFFYLYS